MDDRRESSARRGYDRTWRRVRLFHLQEHPLCVVCLETGQTTAATEVDHIAPLTAGGERLDSRNLRSLCERHHKQITAAYRLTGKNELPT